MTRSPDDLARFMQSHALFGGLPDEVMPEIIGLMKEERFEAGELIVREGDRGDRMYFILTGRAVVEKDATPDIPDDTENATLMTLHPGDSFGEMGLIDTQARSASVRARKAVTTLSLSGRDLHRLYKSKPEIFTLIILNLAREFSRRLRKMDERLIREKTPPV